MGDVLLWTFLILLIPIGAAPIVYIIYMSVYGFKHYNDVNLARNGYSPEQIAKIRSDFKAAGEGIGFWDYYSGRYRNRGGIPSARPRRKTDGWDAYGNHVRREHPNYRRR